MTTANSRPPEFEVVARKIEGALTEYELPSVSVAVSRHGDILWEEGFGWPHRERRIAATADTMYSLASISKPFATTALMILVERGQIGLDDDVNKYLGDGKLIARQGNAGDATIRRLANHTAGLPVHHHYFYADEQYSPPSMEETIRRYGNLVTAPGERYQYANLGYGILGHIIERVSGESYAEFLEREVLRPLGLTRSSVWVPPAFEAHAAREYGADNVPYPRKTTDHPASGNIYASVHDLVRFGQFHLKQRRRDGEAILQDVTIDAMQIPTAHVGGDSGYGIGWITCENTGGYRTIGHEGGSGGVTTQLLMFPTEGIIVAVLTNSSRPNPYIPHDWIGGGFGLLGDIVSVLLPTFGEQSAQTRSHVTQSSAMISQGAKFFQGVAGHWEGEVHTDEGGLAFSLHVTQLGDARAQLGGEEFRVNDLALLDGYVTGNFPGTIPTHDARRFPHNLAFQLTLRGDTMNGVLIVEAPVGSEGGVKGHRLRYALAHWTELRRGE